MNFLLRQSIYLFGWFLHIIPRPLLILLCKILAVVVLIFLPSRRSLVIGNLKVAFPEYNAVKLIRTAFRSVCYSMEQGLLMFAWTHFSDSELKRMFTLNEANLLKFDQANEQNNGILWLIPHFCHADALSITPAYIGTEPGVHALYRPLRNEVVNSVVKNTRERFGIVTIDRKDGGILKTLKVIKKAKTLVMLFDQNAGGAGTRLKFFDQECSCTTLPDILHEKYKPEVLFVYTRRRGFWQSTIEVEGMSNLKKNQLLIEHANVWLEEKLRNDTVLRESWLWMHQRWKPNVGRDRKGKKR